ncbi:MAG: RNase adaptor protein RapZ, partial [Acidimicrobiales bacterium]|nr:RNase adaptor protein RapZ [Acidimicrobiales bacterium]
MSEVVVITGMSGAGRSTAGDNLEDLGWFVMDNLPPSLIAKVAELADGSGSAGDRLALVVGTGRHHDQVVGLLGDLRSQGERLQLVFLDASTEVLVRRYESSRRVHPFAFDDSAPGTLSEIIEAERQALEPLRAEADLLIDTTELNVHQLRSR